MTFLWLTRYPPYPPLKGGALDYTRVVVDSLTLQGPVQGLAFEPPMMVEMPDSDGLDWELLPRKMPSRVSSLLSSLPNVASRNVDSGFLRRAVALAANAEAVFVDFIAMAWLVEPLARAFTGKARRPLIVMVTHNHEHDVRLQMARNATSLAMRAALSLDAFKAGRLERRANRAADGLTGITSTDCENFARDADTPAITLPPAYDGQVLSARVIDSSVPRVATILGNRDAHHKIMVLERTLASMARLAQAGVTVSVAGSGNFTDFAQRYPAIRFEGYVEDLAVYLRNVRVGLLTDDIGGGFKIRALTYALLRVPMIALREAMAGMELVDGVHFIGVDTLAELGEATTRLIDDFDQLNRIQEAAFAFAVERFHPSSTGPRLVDFVASLRPAQAEIGAR